MAGRTVDAVPERRLAIRDVRLRYPTHDNLMIMYVASCHILSSLVVFCCRRARFRVLVQMGDELTTS